MKTSEQQNEATEQAKQWSKAYACDESEYAVAFHSFMQGHDFGFKLGREMTYKEIFDYYLELRKKHGQQEPEHKPVVEKFSITLIEKKGFF